LTSDRKIDANRANAQFSTGPQTKPGRARAARNALRHGLNLPAASSDPAFSEEIEALAREIAGPTADPQILDLARQVAERQIDVDRVRYARHELLSRSLADPHDPTAQVGEKRAVLRRLFKKSAPTLPQTTAVQNGTSVSKAPRAVALTLARATKLLVFPISRDSVAIGRTISGLTDCKLLSGDTHCIFMQTIGCVDIVLMSCANHARPTEGVPGCLPLLDH
jgi:hypothetical protein